MGHIRYGGQVSKDTLLGTAMLRVDVPQTDTTFVTQMVNPSSIYRITFCDEALARIAANSGNSKPLENWTIRQAMPALPATTTTDDDSGIVSDEIRDPEDLF
jgi:hypothetical protein